MRYPASVAELEGGGRATTPLAKFFSPNGAYTLALDLVLLSLVIYWGAINLAK